MLEFNVIPSSIAPVPKLYNNLNIKNRGYNPVVSTLYDTGAVYPICCEAM